MAERFITIKEVTERTTLSKTRIYQLMKEDKFPAQIPLGKFKVVWLESDVDQWMLEQIERPIGRADVERRTSRSRLALEARGGVG